MTDPQPAPDTVTVTVASQSIELLLTGKPDVRYKWGSGSIRPSLVVFTYRQEGIHAHLYGVWVREDGELTDDPCDQEYRIGGPDDWPDWLADLARKHAPADRAALRDRIAEVIHDDLTNHKVRRDQGRLGIVPRLTDAVLAVLPAPADRAVLSDTERQFLTFALDQAADEMSLGDGFTDEDRAALEKLRRMADEAQPPETQAAPDPSWPRRAWNLGLLHKGGDPHHCPACVAQPEPPKDFICPGAEANAEVLANPQPAAGAQQPKEA